jgi:hypothetical protein
MAAEEVLWVRPAPSAGPFAATVITGVLAGGMFGGVVNMINGIVSPRYFVAVLNWRNVDDVWSAVVAQGVFEGLLFGLFFSTVFAAATGIITRAACSFRFCVRHLLGIVAAIAVCWFLGGLAGVGLAALSRDFFEMTFHYGSGVGAVNLLRFAWVGGSIWGAELGGLASLIVGIVVLRAHWHRIEELQTFAQKQLPSRAARPPADE